MKNYNCKNYNCKNYNCLSKKLGFTILLVVLSYCGYAQTTDSFTSSTTWICPAGVTSIQVEAYGAGGGGGRGGGSNRQGGGGGGGGAYTVNTTVAVTPGVTYTITIGTGGSAGISGFVDGGNATATTATFGATTVTANGGSGGLGYTNGRTGGAGGTAGTWPGGAGANGTNGGGSGGGGGAAGTTSAGGNGTVASGGASGTGGTIAGDGGAGSTSNGAVGSLGGIYGGGGGGGTRNSNGGAGADGYLLITYYPPTITSLGSSSGCVGTSITINGTYFTGATAANVKIGGTAVSSITSNSGTVLVAVVGAGTTGTVSVTTTGGTATSVATFTVNPLPTANAGSALSPICSGGITVALGGSFGGSATSAVWSTTSGGTFSNNSGSTPATTTWTPPGGFSGTATLILTTAGGSCGTTTASKTQQVNTPTVNVGSALADICTGGVTAPLGGSFGGTATSAIWSDGGLGGTFANNSGSTPGTTTWTTPIGYTGTATLTLTTSGGSCGSAAASKNQIVIPAPSYSNAGPDQNIGSCATTATLAGNTPAVGTGSWSVVSGTATITTPSSPTSGVTGLVVGATATLRWAISNGTCTTFFDDINLISTSSIPAQPSVITGSTTPCAGSSQTYSVTAVGGVSYAWTFPSGWTQTAGGTSNSVTVTTNGNSGTITVTPSNPCVGTARTLAVTTTAAIPAQPSTITGSTTPCSGTSQSYSVTNVSGTTYTWTFPSGWTQTGGGTTNSITVTTNGNSGNITVTPSNSCGNGTARTLAVTPTTVPAQPSTITGSTTPCSGTSQVYSVTAVSGVTYAWTFPSGWTITAGGTTNSVTVTTTASSGNISVTPSNACGAGTASTLAITTTTIPAQPSAITGSATPCSATSQTYSVTNVPGTTYTWTFPSGWSQTAGGTTNSITVTTTATSGNVTVTPSNPCGNGTARTLAVTPTSAPAQPSTITGNTTPCSGSSQVYSVTAVGGVAYAWTFPTGWTQTGGGTSNSVTVTTNGNSGTITVTPSTSCDGIARTLDVIAVSALAQPSTITGSTTVCSGFSQSYSVTDVPGTTYTWAFPSGWTQTAGGTTNSITVTSGSTSGNISVTPSNSCGTGPIRTLAVTTNISPTITSTTPGSRNGSGSVVLSATASAGTISWFTSLTGGSAISTGPSFNTPGLINTTTYYVATNDGTCSSTPRIAVVATINYPEITVLGNGIIILDEETTPNISDYTNLGTVVVGANITRSYTIQNSGTAILTIGTITIGGVNSSEFVVTTAPAASVVPGGSTTFSIRFLPTALGTRNANVSFVTNDPDENPFNFDIAGVGSTGLYPTMNVQGLGITIVDGDSGPTTTDGTDFGSVTIPGTVVRSFTIRNTGTGPLLLTGSPYVVITGSPYFTVTAQPSSNTIAAGSNLTFQVTYNPLLTGSSVAIISINNNDTNINVYDFAISGAAVVTGKEIDVQGNEVSIVAGSTSTSTTNQTDFGITDSTTPITLTYTVHSFGTVALTLTSTIARTGPDASMFTVTTLPTSLAAGAVTSFVITFTPTATLGIKNATITITNDDPDEGTYSFAVKAEVNSLTPLTVAPGGVTTNLKFWLKANSNIGIVSDNSAINTWTDQTYGGTKNATSKFSKEPKFYNNPSYNVNFNPVIHFNGTDAMTGGQGFNNADMYIVVKPTNPVTYTTSPMDVYCGDDITTNKNSQDVTGFEMGNTSSRHTNEIIAYNQGANTSFGVAEISTTKIYSGVNIFNPRKNATFPTIKMDILNNGNTLTTASVLIATYKEIVNTRYWLGRSEFFDASYDGDILEVINYNTRNTDADKSKIQTYLAIKYGITLGINGTSLNYVDSAGATIYGAGASFNYNIAGIGRDDNSQLNQKQSKTENTNTDITIGLGNIYSTNSNNPEVFAGDKRFLVWGHNNNTLSAQAPISVDMSAGVNPPGSIQTLVDFISIARTWRVIETGGDVPSVKVSIPTAILTATINPPGDFYMFISDNPLFSTTAEYRIMRANDTNLETDYDFSGTKYITFGYAPERTYERSISFDGINDYLDAGKVLDLETTFTVSAWVKRNSTNQTILSKRDSAFSTGYDLKINSAGRAEMSWINGSLNTITSSIVIPSGVWHNIAVTYDGTTAKLYIDGVLDTSLVMPTVPANTQSFLIAAADGTNTTSFFNGGIDEVRVWKVALTDIQLRYVMNQEINRNATFTGGRIIPNTITLNEIGGIPWVNLSAYYPMSTYTFTNAKDASINNYTAALKNLNTVDEQTAPIPYESTSDGTWQTPATWLNNTVQDLPNSLSIVDGVTPINWNIVKTNNNVVSTGNKTVLGLFVNSNTLSATNDSKIEVSNYLKIDGKIDLVGMSQLIQTINSDLEVTSSGSIERDQQGQANLYNYNYWCSPVSPINTTQNNLDYTLAGVMKDGFNPIPRSITWINGVDGITGNALTPMSISRYWLYKFDNYANLYANWSSISENTDLRVGQGYTMKGSGTSGTQNYTFEGKPNNGTINTNTVSPDQLLLTGNPYPSALDADAFITDNASSIDQGIDGTLYFWEQYTTNSSHILSEYEGGYGVKNLVGGVAPVSDGVEFISQNGSSSKGIPNRYIPIGQGFFVNGSSTGGTVLFQNNQRAFIKENDAVNSNSLYKTRSQVSKIKYSDYWNNNSNDMVINNNYKKIRLGFNSSNNYHRQLLLGFMNEKATSAMDYGYDAISIDDLPNDMYFLNGNHQLVIQGEGYFNEEASFPIGIKTDAEGKISFSVDALENFAKGQKIYIFDSELNTHNEIQNNVFEIIVPKGVNDSRFSLRFKNNASAHDPTLNITEKNSENNSIQISHSRNENTLTINNNSIENTIEKVSLFTILGQSLTNWKIENQNQKTIQIPLKKLSAGVYIVKLATSRGEISKKIIIN